ncbi:hypothetical protein NQ317_018212 [Molorchus minor]|uniref:Uncharacterized protein n=1 Tax=Molorchus minor TaxID=1323400 RepID=A0ABQ9K429_9CUCU|nr:hypothetical protein NQ317_018212 [Molorchus minor]
MDSWITVNRLTNTEIIELLSTLAQYPPCESYSSHNFHDIWSCLDDICCWKMAEWDIEMCFTIANLWYKLNLGKLCDFIYVLVDRLTKKADNLTKDQLVSVFFYFNVCRKRAVDFEYEYALQKHMNSMSIDEIAVISMGYFKTRTKIKLLPIMETIVQKVKENSKTIHEISLTAILKIIRYSKPTKIIIEVRNMLDVLGDEIHRLSSLCCLHIALIGTGLQFPHIKTLQEVSRETAQRY